MGLKVKDVCTRTVRSCLPETNLAELGRLLWAHDCGTVPVVDRTGRLAGILTDRDICIALTTRNQRASDLTAGDVMTTTIAACAPDDDLQTALNTMWTHKVRRLPVVDWNGLVYGLLSINDAILAARKPKGAAPVDLSYEDVVVALQAISAHREESTLGDRELVGA